MKVACLLFACVWLAACVPEQEDQLRSIQSAPLVVVAPLQFSNERTRIEAVGTSRANRSITLFPAVSGEVVKVRFTSGQYVEAGDVLLELDQRDQKLAVELAEVQLAEAQRLFERYQESAATGATLPTILDAARTELNATRIALDRARISLEDRVIEAPFAGFVGINDIDVGDRIQSSTPIATLDDRSTLLVSFAVPELMSGKIIVGDEVAISTWSSNNAMASGEVFDIDSRINPETRTFTTRARIDNQADDLRPGMSFRVILELEGDNYPILQEVSVQWGADGSYVWLVKAGKVSRMPVEIVQRQRGKVLVETQLASGDLVVVEGIQRLRPGMAVATKLLDAASS
ncbi:MAG: membrane fusion protein (multidrug efflux system) [Candidatus Azotimanducaceae bacterium]|jgi:membrane fusion protein (multidrug efflux system)